MTVNGASYYVGVDRKLEELFLVAVGRAEDGECQYRTSSASLASILNTGHSPVSRSSEGQLGYLITVVVDGYDEIVGDVDARLENNVLVVLQPVNSLVLSGPAGELTLQGV